MIKYMRESERKNRLVNFLEKCVNRTYVVDFANSKNTSNGIRNFLPMTVFFFNIFAYWDLFSPPDENGIARVRRQAVRFKEIGSGGKKRSPSLIAR